MAVCLFLKKHRSQKGRLNMKLKDTFVTQEMDGEQVMVEADGGFAGMVRSNATAAFIIDQLKTETTKEAILDAMEKKYDAPRAVMAEDVDMVLANLKKLVRWMRKSTFEEEIAHNGFLLYRNVGDSMLPLIRQGKDLLLIARKPQGRLNKYDVPLYRRDSGQYVLHRILKVRKNDYVLCGDNRWRRETGITDRHIIGVLTAVIRDGQKLPVTDQRYRLYVHLWCDLFYLRAAVLWCRDLPGRIKRKLCQ